MPDLEGDAKIEQLFTKQVVTGANTYELAVAKSEQTRWHWCAFLTQDNAVLDAKRPIVNERQEAMKEAHFLANFREHVGEDYPEDYFRGWHEQKVLPTGFIC